MSRDSDFGSASLDVDNGSVRSDNAQTTKKKTVSFEGKTRLRARRVESARFAGRNGFFVYLYNKHRLTAIIAMSILPESRNETVNPVATV